MLLTTSKDAVAREMVHGLPFKLVQLVQGDEFKGGKLINLKSDLAKPCAHDLAINYVWLLPFVKASPQKAMFGKQIFCGYIQNHVSKLHVFLQIEVTVNIFPGSRFHRDTSYAMYFCKPMPSSPRSCSDQI